MSITGTASFDSARSSAPFRLRIAGLARTTSTRALCARDAAAGPQCVVALPLAAARQRERGFNQAHEIARRVARHVGLPQVAALERVAAAVPQAALPWSERARNVRGVFASRSDV